MRSVYAHQPRPQSRRYHTAMWSNRLSNALTDASEPAADLDAPNTNVAKTAVSWKRLHKAADQDEPKTNIAKTAVAATFEEDNVRYCAFDEVSLKALPRGASDEERMSNKNRLCKKLEAVQESIKDGDTRTESMRCMNKRAKWLLKEIAKETTQLLASTIKNDKAMERKKHKGD